MIFGIGSNSFVYFAGVKRMIFRYNRQVKQEYPDGHGFDNESKSPDCFLAFRGNSLCREQYKLCQLSERRTDLSNMGQLRSVVLSLLCEVAVRLRNYNWVIHADHARENVADTKTLRS